MSQGLAERPVPCTQHPHRSATDHCADCLVRGRPELLCRACWAAATARAARAARRQHPLYGRVDALRVTRASAVAGAVCA